MNTNLADYSVTELDLGTAATTIGGANPVSDAAKELLVYAGKCIIDNWSAFSSAFSTAYGQY